MSRSIRIDKHYPYPPHLVWEAITKSDLIEQWLMPNDFELELGREFTLRAEPAPGFDGIVQCRVLEIVEPEKLVWSWAGGGIDTRVTFALREEGDGTRFTMTQSGFTGLKPTLISLILKSGSNQIYGIRLPKLLARMTGQEPAETESSEPTTETEARGWRFLAKLFAPILRRKKGNNRGR